jgi:hypothetical protein
MSTITELFTGRQVDPTRGLRGGGICSTTFDDARQMLVTTHAAYVGPPGTRLSRVPILNPARERFLSSRLEAAGDFFYVKIIGEDRSEPAFAYARCMRRLDNGNTEDMGVWRVVVEERKAP